MDSGCERNAVTAIWFSGRSLYRVLPEEDDPVEKSELTPAALSIKSNIAGICLALLDKYNVEVKKVLSAEHPIDQVESLTCTVTDCIAWIRKASKDPTFSTYARKENAKSEWINAKWEWRGVGWKSYLTGRCHGGLRVTSSFRKRSQFTQPVDSLEMAILKLRSNKQRVVQTHTIEANQTEERPRTRQEKRKKDLKAQGKRDQSKDGKTSGRGTVLGAGEKCLLCDRQHTRQLCRFLKKCRKLYNGEKRRRRSVPHKMMSILFYGPLMLDSTESYHGELLASCRIQRDPSTPDTDNVSHT